MFREAVNKLRKWSNATSRKPLIIRGARQVGKTYLVRDLAKSRSKYSYFELNFERNPELNKIFGDNYDVNRIISELEIWLGEEINIEKDILFFDEVQSCPRALASMRYFFEEMPELRLIAAGSLLEFTLGDIPFPVGRVELMNLYPMTFSEFLTALGQKLLAKKIREGQMQSEVIHDMALEYLKKYFIVGGMPECVLNYSQNSSFKQVLEIQKDLLETYRQDFVKYKPKVDGHCLSTVLNSLAKNIGNQIKYSNLCSDYSNPTIHKAFDVLEKAKLTYKVKSTSPSGLPLGANASSKKFKAIFLDIGLLSAILGYQIINIENIIDSSSLFNGLMAEQFVGQELLANNKEVYYWSRNAKSSNAEVDYLVSHNGNIVPIEVKSGSKGRLKSLLLLLESFPNVEKSYVFNEGKFLDQSDEKIKFRALYFVGAVFGE